MEDELTLGNIHVKYNIKIKPESTGKSPSHFYIDLKWHSAIENIGSDEHKKIDVFTFEFGETEKEKKYIHLPETTTSSKISLETILTCRAEEAHVPAHIIDQVLHNFYKIKIMGQEV